MLISGRARRCLPSVAEPNQRSIADTARQISSRRLSHDAHGTRAGGEIYPKLAFELVKGGVIGLGADAVTFANCHKRAFRT